MTSPLILGKIYIYTKRKRKIIFETKANNDGYQLVT